MSDRDALRVYRIITVVNMTATALAVASLLSGCGASALERHTMAAGILHGATGVAASVVERRAEMAAESATPETIDAVQQRWERIAAGQRVVAASVNVYVAEVIAMGGRVAAGDDDDTRVLRALSEALSVYRALADMLAEYGVTLPSVARVLALVGGAL